MSYTVRYTRAAQRGLRHLPPNVVRRIAPYLDSLESDPRPHGTRSIVGQSGPMYRIRVGDYRIVFHVNDEE
jgi:mRNA interferase RelE/StbE